MDFMVRRFGGFCAFFKGFHEVGEEFMLGGVCYFGVGGKFVDFIKVESLRWID